MNKFLFAFSFICIIASTVAIRSCYQRNIIQETIKSEIKEKENFERIGISEIKVINENEFDLLLKDNRRIKVHLTKKAISDAKEKLITFLNQSKNPEVLFKEKKEDFWIVFIYVKRGESEIELSDWLKQQNLIYN